MTSRNTKSNRASCVNLSEDAKLLLRVEYGIENLSGLINDLLWAFIDENTPEDANLYARGILVKKAAEKVRKERLEQKKLIEEQKSYEQKAREVVEKHKELFNEHAAKFFRNPAMFKKRLPEMDIDGIYISSWDEIAKTLSHACGFPVSPEDCCNWVRGNI